VQDTSEEFRDFADVVMNAHGLTMPVNAREALNLYILLLEEIEQLS
jgi:hypothetical protein